MNELHTIEHVKLANQIRKALYDDRQLSVPDYDHYPPNCHDELLKMVELMDKRFRSMNAIPIDKAMVSASEWHKLADAIKRLAR
jgi:hypothetical protein